MILFIVACSTIAGRKKRKNSKNKDDPAEQNLDPEHDQSQGDDVKETHGQDTVTQPEDEKTSEASELIQSQGDNGTEKAGEDDAEDPDDEATATTPHATVSALMQLDKEALAHVVSALIQSHGDNGTENANEDDAKEPATTVSALEDEKTLEASELIQPQGDNGAGKAGEDDAEDPDDEATATTPHATVSVLMQLDKKALAHVAASLLASPSIHDQIRADLENIQKVGRDMAAKVGATATGAAKTQWKKRQAEIARFLHWFHH